MKIAISITTIKRENGYTYLENMLSDLKSAFVFNNENYIITVSESGTIKENEKRLGDI